MKHLILVVLGTLIAASAFGATTLTCKTSGAGGSIYKQLVLEREPTGYILKTETYRGGGLAPQKILSSISTPVSTKFTLTNDPEEKISLVVYKNQAVILYEAGPQGEQNDMGSVVEFLTCR